MPDILITGGIGLHSGESHPTKEWRHNIPEELSEPSQEFDGTWGFAPVEYDFGIGELASGGPPHKRTGITVKAVGDKQLFTDHFSKFQPSALPSFCPWCDSGSNSKPGPFYRGRNQGQIRSHDSGMAATQQLFGSQLHRSMGETVEHSKTIIFNDNRESAANVAAGAEKNQFKDLLRQIFSRLFQEPRGPSS